MNSERKHSRLHLAKCQSGECQEGIPPYDFSNPKMLLGVDGDDGQL
jgi:hypothetical protein